MSKDRIRSLFEPFVKTWADDAEYPVAFEDVPFTPPELNPSDPNDSVYLRVWVIPARTTNEDVAGVHRAYRGVLQIDVVYPKGAGRLGDQIAARIVDLVQVNLRLTTSAGFAVQVMTPMSEGPAIDGEHTNTVPVSCTYRSDTI